MKTVLKLLLFSTLCFQIKGESICYDGLGCFTDQPPWGDTDERPVGYLPSSPEDVNARFFLDTRSEADIEVFNTDMDALSKTTFDWKKGTKFIVHGYIQNGDTSWMTKMSDALLADGDFNIIRVGWIGGSLTINYALSATDTQIVGAEVALFINNIIKYYGASADNFHCIGHSLGAQACSYLGAKTSSKVGRITGLDPAGPYFENTPLEVRLDSTDAQFVDVLHSDAEKLVNFGFGINQVSGHVDFWPNDGIAQPGCDQNILSTIIDPDGIWQGSQNFVACNHLRAIDLYLESIKTTTCPFVGNPCVSYSDYLAGKCLQCPGNVCPSMGYHSVDQKDQFTSSQPSYFLSTKGEKPYCEFMTYVQVTLGQNSDGIDGKLYLTLYSPSGNTEQQQLSDEDVVLNLRPSTTFSYVTQYQTFPSGFNKVKLLWTQEEFTVYSQHITVERIDIWVDHEQKQYSFCGDISEELSENVRYSYYEC